MTTRFAERNAEIVRLRVEDKLTLQEIADIHEVSRERIRQILEKAGVDVSLPVPASSTKRRWAWIESESPRIIERLKAGEEIEDVARDENVSPFWITEIWRSLSAAERRAVIVARYQKQYPAEPPWEPLGARYTNEDCLEAIRRVAIKVGRIPSQFDYYRHQVEGEPSVPLIRLRFGGWTPALTAAIGKETA